MTNCKFCFLKIKPAVTAPYGGLQCTCYRNFDTSSYGLLCNYVIVDRVVEPNLARVGNRCYSLSQNWN